MRALYTLTIFLGSALLFLVEPAIAKLILPVFGGSPSVWSASLLFFQGALLAGYAYAHGSNRRFGPRRQAMMHLVLMLVAGFFLPFGAKSVAFGWVRGLAENQSIPPALLVLVSLTALVGMPFFILSSQAPTIQRWFASTRDRDAKNPYFLYSASNLGSMLALLAYPFLIESRLGLAAQGQWWAIAYAGLVGITAVCALTLPKEGPKAEEAETEPATPISTSQRGNWVMLAAVPSSLLMGVTTYVSTNVAPVPLLWVVPLALYLLSFIFAFARKSVIPAVYLGRLLPLIATPLAVVIVLESSTPLLPLAALHLSVFFVAAWMCHARLHDERPSASHLTEFYLWVAVGGVVGGLFNALIAPTFFSTLAEYPVAIVAALALRPKQYDRAKGRGDYLFPLLVGATTLVAVMIVRFGPTVVSGRMSPPIEPGFLRTFAIVGVPTILCFFAVDRPVRFAMCLGSMFFVSSMTNSNSDGNVITSQRSFFGVHRVVSYVNGRYHRLVHGNTLHGIQDTKDPSVPLTYYYPTGPIGQLFTKLKTDLADEHVALVGLGVGSLAAYGQAGQTMSFFEIDPTVKKVATDPQYFTYLRDSKATIDIVMGDARLTLANQPAGEFKLIVLDAFSSDAIPVHLLTKEAVQMYVKKLKAGGILAFHISNRYLDLEPVLHAIANDLGLTTLYQEDGMSEAEETAGKTQSKWMLMTTQKSNFAPLRGKGSYWDNTDDDGIPLPAVWTDDFSNVLGAIKPEDQ